MVRKKRQLRKSPRAGLRAILRRNRFILRAWAVFFFWIGLFSAVAMAGGFHGIYRALTHHVATVTAGTLTLLGHPARASGEHVSGDGLSLEIIPPCTGFLPTLLFLAAVFAFPCTWRAKALGLAVGVPGIYLVNLVRVVSLYFVGVYFPSAFEQAHLLVWQPLVIFSSVALWLLWVTRVTRPGEVAVAP